MWSDWVAKRTRKGAFLRRLYKTIRISVLVSLFAGFAWLRNNPQRRIQLVQALQMGKLLLQAKVQSLVSD